MSDWKHEAEKLRFDENKSWSEVYIAIKPYFSELTDKQIEEKVRGYLRRSDKYKADAPTGVFTDIHAPFDHPNFPYFLQDTFKKYGVEKKICCGDIVDNHATSRHGAEPCALGAYSELDLAIQHLKVYYTLFPEVDYVPGNHDGRIASQAARVGIGKRFLIDMHEVLEFPEAWVDKSDRFGDYIYNDVLYSHGEDACGANGARNKSIRECMSVVVGHSHSFGGCNDVANKQKTMFGMNAGCGINDEAYAFVYGKKFKYRPTLGCGIVFNSESAIFIHMGKEYL